MATIEEIVRAEKEFADVTARSDCVEFVDKSLTVCCDAIAMLQERLHEMGYPVSSLVTPPKKGLSQRIARIETHTGLEIPALLKRFWAIVGGISFVDLEDYSHVAFWKELNIRGKKGYCDGVHLDSCTKDWLEFIVEEFDEIQEDDGDGEYEFLFTLSPDGYHKDDISGGDSYGVKNGAWMPPLMNFEWSGNRRPLSATRSTVDLMAYLRTSILECAGFPGLLGNKMFEPIRVRLVESLPIF